MQWSRSGRSGAASPPGRHVGAVARLRAAHRHVRRRDRRPPRVRTAVARRREPPSRARRRDLDAAQGHPDARRDARGDRAARGRRGDRPRGPDHRRRSTSIEYWFVQSGTRIHKTVHYYLMEPTGGDLARHDHEFDAGPLGAVRRGGGDADLRDRARARGARPPKPVGPARRTWRPRGPTP